MSKLKSRGENGQVLLILAVGIFFIMLGSTAFAVDYGNGLLQKRKLQNTADAAALAAATELANGGTTSSAITVAQGIVSTNTGGAVSLPYPGVGTGPGLSQGIEISTPGEVRVALVRKVSTMFASVFGVANMTVAVRSRATVGPYGLLPVAVKRFSAGDDSYALGMGGNPVSVTDYLAPALNSQGQPNSITSWPNPLTSPASPSADYTPPDSYNGQVSGPIVALVGQDAQANVANGNDFHFFVAPDVRNVTAPSPTYYNGITGSDSIQQVKNAESAYFLAKGYPGPNPQVGDQIAVLDGTNTSLTVSALRKTYQRGDLVTAMVYDGTVYRKPDFDLEVDAPVKSSSNIGPGGSPITFQVTLVPNNNFNSTGVQFSATGLEGWGDWQFGSGSLDNTYSLPVSGSGNVSVSFAVSSTSVVQGAKTALIQAYDPATGDLSTVSVTVVVGSAPDFSVSTSQGFQTVQEGSFTRFDMYLQGWNGYPTTTVTVDPVQWFTAGPSPTPTTGPAGVTISVPSTVTVPGNGHSVRLRMTASASATATTGEWMLQVKLEDGNPADTQVMYLTLRIIPSDTGSSISSTTSFVNILGYANFVVTYYNNSATPTSQDNNTVYGYAVSPLVASPNLLSRGLRARLVPW